MDSTTITIMGENFQSHHFRLFKDETNVEVIARMRQLLIKDHSITHDFARKIMHALLIREPAVGKGLVLKMSDLEAQANSCRHVYKLKKDDTLTKMLFGSVPVSENGSLCAYLVHAVRDGHAGYTELGLDVGTGALTVLTGIHLSIFLGMMY
ncbi:hypothetical protein SLS60_010475 [Paraconiothyrium brasiliense]|uniref:Uncharacterized protein n=1 Tax=Paraconiothyrium brasiliense TaxID=300254 RepID=A0ABR3QNT1_9PLEO